MNKNNISCAFKGLEVYTDFKFYKDQLNCSRKLVLDSLFII